MYSLLLKKLDKLDRSLSSLFKELGKYSHQHLNAKPLPGAWSALQVMQHLMTSEKLSLAYLRKKTSHTQVFKKAGWMTALRKTGLRLFLWAPLKWKAPVAVNEQNFPEETTLEEVARQWQAVREDLRTFLEKMPPEWAGLEIYRHPRAGRMTIDGMFVFFSDHFVRHRKQIDRTLKQVASRISE